ncbi:thiamine phosphate synthase [Zunongwangia sp. H14]|uniref:thiamine phosphate synthase n=1 Tax=Zunongwangia sp. H14 TaxID=3240792 RepID=UPI003566ADDB
MNRKKQISGGIYLVIDPAVKEEELFFKLKIILSQEIAAVQIWDNFSSSEEEQLRIVNQVVNICHSKNVPVLLNNNWKLLEKSKADGVHFDEVPEDFEIVRKNSEENALFGLTCNNDLSVIEWAEKHELDYISFCSMFPSQTSNSCEIVTHESVKKAREITKMPIFLAGGIQDSNVAALKDLDFDGIAVVSGIMSAKDPGAATKNYLTELNKLKNEICNHK